MSAKDRSASSESIRPETFSPRRRPTINDIARLARVSKKTVSRVINQSPFVKEETREKINAIIAEHGYTPDPQARGLAFRRSFLIGFVYDNPNPQYVVNAQQGILDGVRGTGFELVIRPCDRGSSTFLSDMRNFVERQKLSGMVLFPSVSEDERLIELLQELDCPYVRIASVALEDDAEAMIVSHDHVGGREAARHLADLGHTRIAHISGPDSFRSSHERRRGFAEGLAARGLRLDPRYDLKASYTFDSGVEAATQLLAMAERPTAIFTGNDEMALGVYKAAHEAGLTVPADLSVIGFDDSPIASRIHPTLTTVRMAIREMGRMAAERLLSGRDGQARAAAEVDIQPKLIARESTAAPA